MFVVVLAGVVLGWVVPALLGPSNQQIRDAADAAVPEGAILNRRWENVGNPLISGPFYAAVEFEMPPGVDVPGSSPGSVGGALRVELTAQGANGPEGGALGQIRVGVDPVAMRHRQEAGALAGAVGLPILVAIVKARRSALTHPGAGGQAG
jgi:hypothetical protein